MSSHCSLGGVIVLVDGRNVERSRWPNVASEELVEAVAEWAARERHDAVVVFDGRAPAGPSGVEVVGTGRESADDWIAARAAELAERGEAYELVTSDRELRRRAGDAAARITGGGSFLGVLGLARH
jgi:predicted RNA-binding protein with PIN domain